MGVILKLVPLNERKVAEVAEALEDLAAMVRQGIIDGLMFHCHTRNGEHFHGLAGHYHVNLTEAAGSLGCFQMRLFQIIENNARQT